ncbi:MAG: long-chain fatty acid--CoA ligase [Bacteroidia bacterium]|nr:long-chain fatty acid--CoA ligase [Bacteroidia bacterium]
MEQEVKRLFDIFPYQEKRFHQEVCLAGPEKGGWVKWSTKQVNHFTDSLALGLAGLGLSKGDMIAIISHTNKEWIIADQGIQKMGGIVIPIYPTSTSEDIAYILDHCGAKAIFAHDQELLDKVLKAKDQLPGLKHYFSFTPTQGAQLYTEIFVEPTQEGLVSLSAVQDQVQATDLATIIYTSGTTGKPKGVMLSHYNILSNLYVTKDILPVNSTHIGLSFLPLSHIFERMINYLYFYTGISVYYAESIEMIGPTLKEIRPNVFTAVPRLLEKVFDKIVAGGQAEGGMKTKIFNWALDLALHWLPDGQNGGWYNFKLKIADKLVFSKIRAKAGLDRVIASASGSAALNPRLLRFFNAAGVPLTEGYGLTETSPVISVGQFIPHGMKVGTVGQIIPNGEVKIAEDGEILFKGPNVMLGYYHDQEKTDEVIDPDGWFHTGDIGVLDKDGFLKITDRKKEIFKTSGGKYIAPQLMENKFKESPFINQVMVIGEYRKFPGALIVPNFEALTGYLADKGISYKDHFEDICKMKEVNDLFESEMERLNVDFNKWEKVKRWALIPKEWTPDSGLITPTLKLKRKVILEHFKDEVEGVYNV